MLTASEGFIKEWSDESQRKLARNALNYLLSAIENPTYKQLSEVVECMQGLIKDLSYGQNVKVEK